MSIEEQAKGLPRSVMEGLIDKFDRDPRIVELNRKRSNAIARRDYVGAVKLKGIIEEIKKKYLQACLDEQNGEVVALRDLFGKMEDKDVNEMCVLSNAIVMCCDLIETLTMDFNQLFRKYEPEGSVIMYDKLMDVGRVAKEHVAMLGGTIDDFYVCSFGDYSDDMHDMLVNKVRSLIRKTDEHESKKRNGKVDRAGQ